MDAHRQELRQPARHRSRARAADAELRAKLSAQELAAKATQDAAIWEALRQRADQKSIASRRGATAQQSAALQQQNKQLQAELVALSAAAQALPSTAA